MLPPGANRVTRAEIGAGIQQDLAQKDVLELNRRLLAAALGQPGGVAVQGLEVRLLDLAAGQWRTLATLRLVPEGVGIDIVGLINTLSWTP